MFVATQTVFGVLVVLFVIDGTIFTTPNDELTATCPAQYTLR